MFNKVMFALVVVMFFSSQSSFAFEPDTTRMETVYIFSPDEYKEKLRIRALSDEDRARKIYDLALVIEDYLSKKYGRISPVDSIWLREAFNQAMLLRKRAADNRVSNWKLEAEKYFVKRID